MKKVRVTVTYRVPSGLLCNHTPHKSTASTRCRFCTDLGRGIFICVLYNEPLSVSRGVLIMKTAACLAKEGTIDEAPLVPTKDIMVYAISEYQHMYSELIKNGLPIALAEQHAKETVLKEVK